jgi:hypothetical protein
MKWTPGPEQVMMHKIIVRASDGIDDTDISFTIDVRKGEYDTNFFPVLILVGAAVLILVVVIAAFLMIRKRKGGDSQKEENDEPEEQVIGSFDDEPPPQVKCDVALSPTEAHAHLGKGSAQVSYEDLYGAPPPSEDDEVALTTSELKDFINNSIGELEDLKDEEE